MMKNLKKVGKPVCFLRADEKRPRMGEGSFIRLNDGTIMFAYSEFCGESYRDHAYAKIAAVFSHDEGETWGEHRILAEFEPNETYLNMMSVSLVRLNENKILMFHGMKKRHNDDVITIPHMRISTDEAKTWSDPIPCWDRKHYYVMNNDRVQKLRSGRLIIPVAKYESLSQMNVQDKRYIELVVSDDEGATWRFLDVRFQMPFDNTKGFEEPGVYEHEDGTLWCYFRTNIGCQFETFSTDGGETWTTPRANIFFTSARAPMMVKKVGGKYTVSVFNPIMKYTGRDDREIWGRTPYLLAVSENDGITHDEKSFERLYFLEDDMTNVYCYSSVFDGGDYFLVAYYHSDGGDFPMRSMMMKKVLISEIQN